MLKNQLITPEGTKDFLFEEAAVREEVETLLHTLFKTRGFSEVITPGLEFLDVFSVKGHSIPVEYMYKLSDHKGRLMVLRPDSTMPIGKTLRDAAAAQSSFRCGFRITRRFIRKTAR